MKREKLLLKAGKSKISQQKKRLMPVPILYSKARNEYSKAWNIYSVAWNDYSKAWNIEFER